MQYPENVLDIFGRLGSPIVYRDPFLCCAHGWTALRSILTCRMGLDDSEPQLFPAILFCAATMAGLLYAVS